MIPTSAYDMAQVRKAQTKTSFSMGFSKFNEQLSNQRIIIFEFCIIAIAGLTNIKCCAGQTNTDGVCGNSLLSHLTPIGQTYPFVAVLFIAIAF